MERPAPTTGRPFAFGEQAFRQLTQSLNETLIVPCQIGGMDPINAYPAADHAHRRLIFPPKPSDSGAPFTPNRDGAAAATAARKPEPLAPKPDEVKNREADEQVTRQRVEDKRLGTLFDLRA